MDAATLGRPTQGLVALVTMALVMGLAGAPVAGAADRQGPSGEPRGGALAQVQPSPGAGPWEPVTLRALEPVATLVADDQDVAGIATDSTFTLTSLTATPAEDLIARLTVDPPAILERVGGDGSRSVVLRPSTPLAEGRTVRVALQTEDGVPADSWVFDTQTPLHVEGTLPRDGADHVPVRTGIEITFDQEGATRADRFFSIEPTVPGRFEMHGRVLAFVPDGLALDTLYRVTLRAGVPIAGSDMRLEQGVRFEFRTRPSKAQGRRHTEFLRAVTEWGTRSPAMLAIWPQRRSVTPGVEVYRLPSRDAAIAAVREAQDGSRWDTSPGIDTSGLPRVMAFTADPRQLDTEDWERWIALPARLPAGWYVVAMPEEAAEQLVLQVTDLATYSQVTTTDAIAWVNDVVTGGPVRDAVVSLPSGRALGRTDADGLARFATPALLRSDERAPLLVVRSGEREVLVPFGGGGWSSEDILQGGSEPGTDHWHFLFTDRVQYRTSDTVNAWGMVRERDTDRVPSSVELRLILDGGYDEPSLSATVPIATTTATPTESGGFAASLPIADAPYGFYSLELWVDGERITSEFVEVARIIKPAYRLAITTDRHVVIAGQSVVATTRATFFDGTAVPALPLRTWTGSRTLRGITDGLGTLTQRSTVTERFGAGEQWSWGEMFVEPQRAEEAQISDQTPLIVFRSSVYLTANAVIREGRATLRGSVDTVDLARLERQSVRALDFGFDPRGEPAARVAVTAAITELIPVRRQTGTRYDFIAKKVVPEYHYSVRRNSLGERHLISAANGTFELSFDTRPGNGYQVRLRATDAAARTTSLVVDAGQPEEDISWAGIYVAPRGESPDVRWDDNLSYSVGERVSLELHDGTEVPAAGEPDRYLFLEAQRGLRRTAVLRTPVRSFRFREWDLPSLTIAAVHWTGDTYLADPYGYTVRVTPADRRIEVTLTPERADYGPGDELAVDVLTTEDGKPVSADVTLRAVDEKLFAIGAAQEARPLETLLASVSAGWLASYASHRLPRSSGDSGFGDSGGQGGGDGGRQDFRDSLLFQMITTDARGHGRVTFDASDDLTSWRVSATALTADLRAGEAWVLVPVGLPFFVEVVSAPEYLASDKVSLRLRAFGDALRARDSVTFQVRSASLGLEPVTVTAQAFEEVAVLLPALTQGLHAVTISGSARSRTGALRDTLTRSLLVVESRLEQGRLASLTLDGPMTPPGGTGLTTILVSDAGRGHLQALLLELAGERGTRADSAIAAAEARRLLVDVLGIDPSTLPRAAFDRAQFQDGRGGIALLPYSSSDLELSTLVAIAAPGSVDEAALAAFVQARGTSSGVPRSQAILSLAALASLGEPVASQLRTAAAEPELSIREQLYVALGLAALGDRAAAIGIERDLLTSNGQQLGSWVRLKAGGPSRTSELTALLSVLAAALGDDEVASGADAYVRADPPTETLASLERIAYVSRRLEHTPASPASFAYTLGGERRTVDLPAGETFQLTLTAPQRTSLLIEPVDGTLALSSTWTEPLAGTMPPQDESIVVTRKVRPTGPIADDQTVEVRISVTVGDDAVTGCYLVTDFAPSGLAPVWSHRRWGSRGGAAEGPWSISGQRVIFCVDRDPTRPTQHLRYQARVVTPGTYAWEPSLVQSVEAPGIWRLGSEDSVSLE